MGPLKTRDFVGRNLPKKCQLQEERKLSVRVYPVAYQTKKQYLQKFPLSSSAGSSVQCKRLGKIVAKANVSPFLLA